ncbi:DNA/RNA polymerase [Morchella conica CCBAS932]|uniref:DNA/RNA polymerase n=1 Tax=Morchella conica CCBAS932 TaxID=1392247 RepID=A0A3N4KCP7_9PEZI|nr:DNA/RNA polymerase [Morchella conica CCBAS932]
MEQSKEPIILHFDFDCFYASVVENENPALKTVPLGIQQKNILATCNYVARAQGVKKLQLITAAKKQCKNLVIVNGEDLTRFRVVSKNIWLFVREFVWHNLTERLGLDEIFIDATEMIDFNMSQLRFQPGSKDPSFFRLSRNDPSAGFPFVWDELPGYTYPPAASSGPHSLLHQRLFLASHLASFIRTQILTNFNHTCSAGISTTKLTAKLAGSVNKPDAQTLLLPGFEAAFLAGHEIGKVPGVGFKSAQKIRDKVLGRTTKDEEIEFTEISEKVTVGTVISVITTPAQLEPLTGGNGQKIWRLLHGIDPSRVAAAPIVPTQISIEDTFRPGRITCLNQLTPVLHQLTLKLLQRMHADLIGPGGEKWLAHPKNFRLSIRFHTRNRDFARMSRSGRMPGYVFSLSTPLDVVAERLVREVVVGLFKGLCTERKWELQLVNVAAVNMADGGGGVDIRDMFSTLRPRSESWENKEEPTEYLDGIVNNSQQYNSPPEKEPEPIKEVKEDEDEGGEQEGEGEEVVELEWGDGLSDSSVEYGGIGSRGFSHNDPCPICGERFPVFALEAHQRFHQSETEIEILG